MYVTAIQDIKHFNFSKFQNDQKDAWNKLE
jgi:hypothetical protein